MREVGINVPENNSKDKSVDIKPKMISSPGEEIVDVALFTEGTYPFIRGGVSTVIHQIIEAHPHLTFGIIYIGWDVKVGLESKYPALPQIKWTKTLFLNEKKKDHNSSFFTNFTNESFNAKVTNELFLAVEDLKLGKTKGFEKIYFNYLNPSTRKTSLKQILSSNTFLELLLTMFAKENMSLNDLFWLQKELIHIFYNLTETQYPAARVYHSHTQGYAGFAASLASLQNQGAFFLTEHSLYLRDVKNALNEDFNFRKNKYAKKNIQVSAFDLKRKAWQGWFELIGTWTYNQAASISYLYPRIASEAQQLGSPLSISSIIPNGIHFQDFSLAREAQKFRASLRQMPNHIWVISLIGRIVPVKGILDIIEAAKYMKENWQQSFRIELVGPTDEDMSYFKSCMNKVESYQLQKVVIFCGPKKVQEYLGQTDLIVLSSHSEALPMASLEGMATGLPVVSTEVGSVADIIHNELAKTGPCGFMSPPKKPLLLAQNIMKLLDDKNQYNTFSENALVRVQDGYNINHVMKAYGNIYRSLSINLKQGEVEFFS